MAYGGSNPLPNLTIIPLEDVADLWQHIIEASLNGFSEFITEKADLFYHAGVLYNINLLSSSRNSKQQ